LLLKNWQNSLKCTYCGYLYDGILDICPHCGGKKQGKARGMWICKVCGHPNNDILRACERCRAFRGEPSQEEVRRRRTEQQESDMWDEDQGLM